VCDDGVAADVIDDELVKLKRQKWAVSCSYTLVMVVMIEIINQVVQARTFNVRHSAGDRIDMHGVGV